MKKAFRIGYFRYKTDEAFAEHIAFIQKNVRNIDEVALFMEYSHHGYWPLEEQREHARLVRSRLEAYRRAGVKSVGLNVLDTIGHLEEAWDVLPVPPMQTMVGATGQVSRSCLCVNTPEYRAYTAERYRLLAESGPDFIWVDDDVRAHSHGVAGPCYCPTCIRKFNQTTGRSETFESLTAAPSPELSALWETFWDDCITEVCALIRESVHGVDDRIELGLMSGRLTNTPPWFRALNATKGRPGGGFYTDESPLFLTIKSIDCANQLDLYPDCIADRQYEFENFPYQELGKSKHITELEVLWALLNGCNGAAFNAIFFKDNQPLMDVVEANKAQWEQITKRTEHTVNPGIFCNDSLFIGSEFFRTGLPITGSGKAPCAVFLDAAQVSRLSDTALEAVLSGHAFVTGDGFDLIEQRGLAHLCGVTTNKIYTNGVCERYTNDPLNGAYVGETRNPFVTFYDPAPRIASLTAAPGVRVLSELYTVKNEPLGPCFTAYENDRGGRVAVCTFVFSSTPWYLSKRTQLFNVFDWLSGGLPVKIVTDCRVLPLLRRKPDGGFVLMLANMSFDPVERLEVDLVTPSATCVQLNQDGSVTPVSVTALSETKRRITIPTVAPFAAVVLADS